MLPSSAPARVVGVKRLADYLRRKVDGDANLRGLAVRGEVSNFKLVRGNAYFALKEGDALLACFAYASDLARFPPLENGAAIVAGGSLSTYVARSSYQLVVRAVERDGFGRLHVLFEDRKRRLSAEGLFEGDRKRPLPRYPFRVALVSSRGANGAQDFTTLLARRAPHVAVVWCETPVQGPNAGPEIAAALDRASCAAVDAIVVTRGGGSFEDLFVFSDEAVVRAIIRAQHPVISAIGHTADQQLADFAADAHAETPSKAAEMLGPATADLRARVDEHVRRARAAAALRVERMDSHLHKTIARSGLGDARRVLVAFSQRADALERRLDRQAPTVRLAERERRLAAASNRLLTAASSRVAARGRALEAASRELAAAQRARLAAAARRLELALARCSGNDPEAILQRGYAIVTCGDAIVRDAAAIPRGAHIRARVARGTLDARVDAAGDRTGENDGDDRSG